MHQIQKARVVPRTRAEIYTGFQKHNGEKEDTGATLRGNSFKAVYYREDQVGDKFFPRQ